MCIRDSTCLVCGGDANTCLAQKRHSMELIQWQTAKLFNDHFRDRSADLAASAAVRGLLYDCLLYTSHNALARFDHADFTQMLGRCDRNTAGRLDRDSASALFLSEISATIL